MVLYTHWMPVNNCWMKRFISQVSKYLYFPRGSKGHFMSLIHLCFLFCRLPLRPEYLDGLCNSEPLPFLSWPSSWFNYFSLLAWDLIFALNVFLIYSWGSTQQALQRLVHFKCNVVWAPQVSYHISGLMRRPLRATCNEINVAIIKFMIFPKKTFVLLINAPLIKKGLILRRYSRISHPSDYWHLGPVNSL